jgi:hypothetical protein
VNDFVRVIDDHKGCCRRSVGVDWLASAIGENGDSISHFSHLPKRLLAFVLFVL